MTIDQFKDEVICRLMEIDSIEQAKRYQLTEEDCTAIEARLILKYRNCGTMEITIAIIAMLIWGIGIRVQPRS